VSKCVFHGKHGDSVGIDPPTRQFNHFDEKEVENTVFHSTYNARMSKCNQQKRRTAKTLGVPCNGLCHLESTLIY